MEDKIKQCEERFSTLLEEAREALLETQEISRLNREADNARYEDNMSKGNDFMQKMNSFFGLK